jgi:ABC-2 type transport system permease protein
MRKTLVRVSTFARAELVSTLRQPRLLLVLVLGPFLVLFVFGLGYSEELPTLSTVVVGAQGDELTDEIDTYIAEEEPEGIAYRGTVDDEEAALADLRAGRVDLVIVLPTAARESVEQGERAVIQVHQRSLDPVTSTQIGVASSIAISRINDRVVEEFVAQAQEQTAGAEDTVAQAREALADLRGSLSDNDITRIQTLADELATQFDRISALLDGSGGFASAFGLGARSDELQETLATASEQLTRLSRLDGPESLADAETALNDIEAAVTTLQSVSPEVIVQPFDVEVVSQTPVRMTLDRFYAPGLIALMLQHIAVTFAALALVRERERRTTTLYRVAPTGTFDRLLGKGLAFLLIGAVAAVGLTALVVLAFGVPMPISWAAFAGVLALTLVGSLGYGYLIAAVSKSDSQAVQFSMLLFLTSIFFAGLFMPLDRITFPVEIVSWLMPATWAFVGLQQLMLLQVPAPPVVFVGLGTLAVVLVAASGVLLSRQSRTAI